MGPMEFGYCSQVSYGNPKAAFRHLQALVCVRFAVSRSSLLFHRARARIRPVCHGEMADCGAGRVESQDECANEAYRFGRTRCRDIFCWFCFWCQHASSQSMLIQKCCANISMYGSDLAFPKACRCYPNRTQRQLAGACKR